MRARWTMPTPASYVVAADRKNLLIPTPHTGSIHLFWAGNVMIACGRLHGFARITAARRDCLIGRSV